MSDMIVTTMNDLPGYRVAEVYGEVLRPHRPQPQHRLGHRRSLRGLVGGEVKGYTRCSPTAACQAVERLRDAAREAGANAVIAMRFDCNELGSNMTEVAA